MTGQFPLFGMTLLSWLTFNINVDIFTQAEDPLNSAWTQDIGCTFNKEGNAKYCGWKPQNWEIVQTFTKSGLTLISPKGNDHYTNTVMEGSPSNLTSPNVTTGENTDCLGFYFFVTGINATLMVSIQRKDDKKTILWKNMSNNYITNKTWAYATMPIKSPECFRVIIESLPTSDTRSVIAVDEIKHYRNLSCALTQTEAEVDQTTSSSTTTPRSAIVSSSEGPSASTTAPGTVQPATTLASSSPPNTPPANSVSPGTTYPHAGPTDDDKEKELDTADNSTAVLAGALTAGVVLLAIIVVIVGLVIWKRRSRENKKEALACEITNDQGKDSIMAATSSDFNTETGRPPLSSSNHTTDSGYSDLSPIGLEPDYSADPYTLANYEDVENAHPKMKPLAHHNDDEYNVLGIHKASQNRVPENDNYSHINNFQPTMSDVSALYSQVNKMRKSTGAEHRLALESDGNPSYTEVKNYGKPATSSESRHRTRSASSELNSQQTGSRSGFRSADSSVRLSPENDAVSFQPAAKPDASALYSQVQKKGRGVSSEVKTVEADITALYSKVAKPKGKPVVAKKPVVTNTPTTSDK